MTNAEMIEQIKETKIECLEDFRTTLLLRLNASERTQIYRNFLDYVGIISNEIIKEEKERLGIKNV